MASSDHSERPVRYWRRRRMTPSRISPVTAIFSPVNGALNLLSIDVGYSTASETAFSGSLDGLRGNQRSFKLMMGLSKKRKLSDAMSIVPPSDTSATNGLRIGSETPTSVRRPANQTIGK